MQKRFTEEQIIGVLREAEVDGGEGVGALSGNWVKAARDGKLTGLSSSKIITPEQMELSRLRAENLIVCNQKLSRLFAGQSKSTPLTKISDY